MFIYLNHSVAFIARRFTPRQINLQHGSTVSVTLGLQVGILREHSVAPITRRYAATRLWPLRTSIASTISFVITRRTCSRIATQHRLCNSSAIKSNLGSRTAILRRIGTRVVITRSLGIRTVIWCNLSTRIVIRRRFRARVVATHNVTFNHDVRTRTAARLSIPPTT